jgi:hypothetical protein
VFENRVLRRIFGLKKEEVRENCIMSFNICTFLPNIMMMNSKG